jgi:hypothetical protein
MRWSGAFLAPMLLLAASSAVAQTVNPVYSPNGPLTTNDCANTAAYNSTKMGTGQHVWYVAPGENGANNWTTLQGDPIDIANGNIPSNPLGGLQYAVSVTSPGDLVCLLGGTYTRRLCDQQGRQRDRRHGEVRGNAQCGGDDKRNWVRDFRGPMDHSQLRSG